MLLDIIIFFLAFSLVLYCLFGGADFGGGILELFVGKHNWQLVDKAISPVWEANHVWLVLIVVILFMGFPSIYSIVSQYLHVPILILLVGIILHGTAFTYRHYDAKKDASLKVYNWVFRLSSVLATFFLGVIVGAAILGRITQQPETFYEGFMAPWINLFSFSVGLFTLFLFSFLAAVYSMGEARGKREKQALSRIAKWLTVATVASGAVVFLIGEMSDLYLLSRFIYSPFAIGSVLISAIILPFLWRSLTENRAWRSRLLAGSEMVLVLVAWFEVQHPVVVAIANAPDLTFQNSAAPESTLMQLVIALVVGSLIILPLLFYLMRVFKKEQIPNA
ncbi:cytochrome d ubiquinol oxidase subunit II [Aliifodinibius sp. S!AR15-10]|uniref:cytochrome d ubiquinol oxidase subunit II n=1 Tax=Aliifodinibius sp. S!AR15-10 TaxID=2950437 RepID=UPI00285E6531|nr:cytochrome d ubiquinol oxidase subunit II [Aliifodinibius sp. S!AR15-10]MDR8391636.1 cytochrome d ubiquinol oxidase subunit II [Aliifodinibius sp. S!AR15-10]